MSIVWAFAVNESEHGLVGAVAAPSAMWMSGGGFGFAVGSASRQRERDLNAQEPPRSIVGQIARRPFLTKPELRCDHRRDRRGLRRD